LLKHCVYGKISLGHGASLVGFVPNLRIGTKEALGNSARFSRRPN
jgi:hypothetical protein